MLGLAILPILLLPATALGEDAVEVRSLSIFFRDKKNEIIYDECSTIDQTIIL